MNKISNLLLLITMALAIISCSDDNDDQNITSIKILQTQNDTIFLNRYDTYQVNIEAEPNNKGLKYFSGNTNVFKVDQSGLITAIDGGAGVLSILAPNGDSWTKTTCMIDVTALVDSISVAKGYKCHILSETGILPVSIVFEAYPKSANNKAMEFKCSKPGIINIDEDGYITAVSKGIVELYAVSTDGGNIESSKITIYSQYSEKSLVKKGWTATASSYASNSYNASKIIDGLTSSMWHCPWDGNGTPPPHWLLVDMKEKKSFSKVKIYRRYNYTDTKTVEVYASAKMDDNIANDDPSFEKIGVISFEGVPKNKYILDFSIFPEYKEARYIKLVLPDNGREGNNSLCELYLYNIE